MFGIIAGDLHPAYLTVRSVLGLLVVLFSRDPSKDAELVVLRVTTSVPTIASSFSESWWGRKNCPLPYPSIECGSAR